MKTHMQTKIKTVLIDFGGVIAEEGFRDGLMAIGRNNGHNPEEFFSTVDSLIYDTGYLIGTSDEASFWIAVRQRTGIGEDDASLRREILSRFVLRPDMLAHVDNLRSRGIVVAMLSDQTNWLEEIDRETKLYSHFDSIFNSYTIHKSKRDASLFAEVCATLGVTPRETLFIDDNINHIKRARIQGLQTIHFVGSDDFKRQMRTYHLEF